MTFPTKRTKELEHRSTFFSKIKLTAFQYTQNLTLKLSTEAQTSRGVV